MLLWDRSGRLQDHQLNMSRIFEALRHAQWLRADKLRPTVSAVDATTVPDRRRSPRLAFDVPVYVYGHGPGEEPFHEEAHTLRVNATGALLLLSVPVCEGQRLLLTNALTQKEQDCRVAFLGTRHSRTTETGVAFPLTNPTFWAPPTAPEDMTAA